MTRASSQFDRALEDRNQNGFTVIELLVTIAIIALLIGILLPSLSRARLVANRTVATHDLKSLGRAMVNFESEGFDFDDDGIIEAAEYRFPTSLTQLVDEGYFHDSLTHLGGDHYVLGGDLQIEYHRPPIAEMYPPTNCAGYDPERWFDKDENDDYIIRTDSARHCASILVLVSGQVEGDDEGEVHLYMDGSADFVHYQGDGSASLASDEFMYVSTAITPPTSDALSPAEIEDRLQQIQFDGMKLILNLLRENGKSDPEYLLNLKRNAGDPSDFATAAALLDCDSDGVIRCDDLHDLANGDKLNSRPELKTFLQESLELLELNPCPDSEDPFGIDTESIQAMGFLVDEALTYDRACELTMSLCDKRGVAKALCAKLAIARGASRSPANIKARNNSLKAFRNLIRAQTGKSLTKEGADTLTMISYILQTASD